MRLVEGPGSVPGSMDSNVLLVSSPLFLFLFFFPIDDSDDLLLFFFVSLLFVSFLPLLLSRRVSLVVSDVSLLVTPARPTAPLLAPLKGTPSLNAASAASFASWALMRSILASRPPNLPTASRPPRESSARSFNSSVDAVVMVPSRLMFLLGAGISSSEESEESDESEFSTVFIAESNVRSHHLSSHFQLLLPPTCRIRHGAEGKGRGAGGRQT